MNEAQAFAHGATLAPDPRAAHHDDVQLRWSGGAGSVTRLPTRGDPNRTDAFLKLHFGSLSLEVPRMVNTHACYIGADLVYVVDGPFIFWKYDGASRAGIELCSP